MPADSTAGGLEPAVQGDGARHPYPIDLDAIQALPYDVLRPAELSINLSQISQAWVNLDGAIHAQNRVTASHEALVAEVRRLRAQLAEVQTTADAMTVAYRDAAAELAAIREKIAALGEPEIEYRAPVRTWPNNYNCPAEQREVRRGPWRPVGGEE